jgi:CheY-like chemotaxis protein
MPVNPGKKTIMIVDDHEGIYLLLGSLLEEKGLTVVTFGSPEPAITHILNFDVDLIVSDYNMPGMNGVRLLTIAREIRPAVKVLLMSANPSMIDDNKAHYRVIEKYIGFFGEAVEVICSLLINGE